MTRSLDFHQIGWLGEALLATSIRPKLRARSRLRAINREPLSRRTRSETIAEGGIVSLPALRIHNRSGKTFRVGPAKPFSRGTFYRELQGLPPAQRGKLRFFKATRSAAPRTFHALFSEWFRPNGKHDSTPAVRNPLLPHLKVNDSPAKLEKSRRLFRAASNGASSIRAVTFPALECASNTRAAIPREPRVSVSS